MNDQLVNLKSKLDKLRAAFQDGSAMPGWNLTQLSNTGIRYGIESIISLMEQVPESQQIGELEQSILNQFSAGIDTLLGTTVGQLAQSSSSKLNAQYAIVGTLQQIRFFIEDLLPKWTRVTDSQLLPDKLARRVKAANLRLIEIEPELNSIKNKLDLLDKAEKLNNELPLELEELEKVRKKVDSVADEANVNTVEIKKNSDKAEAIVKNIGNFQVQGQKFVDQLSALHRVGTSTALAGAFNARANELGKSVYWWGGILLVALGIALWIGSVRLNDLSLLLMTDAPAYKIWIMSFFSFLGIGAPIWVAWIATKQVGQRFRLAEDYAYKASISNAYEGYRREAKNFENELFEAKLFGSALDRLDEVPLRLVEKETHGSPLHEFFNSPVFQKQMETSGEFKDAFIDFMKRRKSSGTTKADFKDADRQ